MSPQKCRHKSRHCIGKIQREKKHSGCKVSRNLGLPNARKWNVFRGFTRNPPGTPVPKRRINVRKQHSLPSLPALPFPIKNRPPSPLKILATPLHHLHYLIHHHLRQYHHLHYHPQCHLHLLQYYRHHHHSTFDVFASKLKKNPTIITSISLLCFATVSRSEATPPSLSNFLLSLANQAWTGSSLFLHSSSLLSFSSSIAFSLANTLESKWNSSVRRWSIQSLYNNHSTYRILGQLVKV